MKLRILIIDDEECIRESLAMYLTDLGHEVVTACDPTQCPVYDGACCTQAVACADVILIDQNMPECKGLDFIKWQASRGCRASIRNKVIMSGMVTKELLQEARQIGCQIIQKPFHFGALDEFLNEVIERMAADA